MYCIQYISVVKFKLNIKLIVSIHNIFKIDWSYEQPEIEKLKLKKPPPVSAPSLPWARTSARNPWILLSKNLMFPVNCPSTWNPPQVQPKQFHERIYLQLNELKEQISHYKTIEGFKYIWVLMLQKSVTYVFSTFFNLSIFRICFKHTATDLPGQYTHPDLLQGLISTGFCETKVVWSLK